MLKLFKRKIKWTRKKYVPNNELEHHCNHFHISIISDYFSNLYTMGNFPELPDDWWEPQILSSFTQELEEMFVVPRLNKFHESQKWINKCQLVEAFLSFLLQLLYHKTDPIFDPFEDRIDNLEKELRFVLTILGDISWMLLDNDEHEAEFQNLLAEFEALANQAGSFVHFLFFSPDRMFKKMDKGLAAVLMHTDLLKAKIQSSISIPAYTTPKASVVDSFLILDSLVDDLEDLLKREDDRIAEVKDQVILLRLGLIFLRCSINDMRSLQPSDIGELKEPLMRIGDMAHQAEYLITSFLVKDAPPWYVINRLTDLNHKIELIRMELQIIAHKYQFGGLKVENYNLSAKPPLQDKRKTENDVTIGLEDKATDILDQLVGGGTETLKVISIFGMPGLGKTTLAKKLYNHPLVTYTFVKLSWCVVSQTYKTQRVLANILIHINSELDKDRILKLEEETLVEQIYKSLKGSRYLIVMDDIWDLNVWEALRRCFPDDGNGSRILLTSRNKDVAPPNSIIHELPFLLDEQCWELLEKKVFGSRTCPHELQGIGKKIAAKCCGLPLTVVVIAGVLSSVDEEESTWEEVGGSLASYIDGEDNSVMETLELSYNHLPDHLKPCFLYFGSFEEDKEISVENLMRLWVAEGFIRKENEKTTEDIAEEYLMELIDKSLVMVAERRIDGRGVKACVVHDLLRDLCLKKSKEEGLQKYLKSDYHTMYEKGQHVRTFFGGHDLTSSLYVRDMRLLRALLHFNYTLDNHIFGIEYLVNLRYLVIGEVPTSLDRLLNLEYLWVKSSETIYLQPLIVKMTKLRYVRAWFVEYGEDWIVYQPNSLEFLSWVSIKNLYDEDLLKCSPHLRKLKCCYEPELVKNRASPDFDLRFLTQLDSLSLKFKTHNFEKFRFPSNIRKLTLCRSMLCWEKMSIVGRLKHLEVLKLRDERGLRWDTRDGEFQKLKFLQLKEVNLNQWNVASSEHFPELQRLILSNCYLLQEIPSEIGEITTLEWIEVKLNCLSSLVESAKRIKEEQQDMGNEDLRVIINTC
ncbi:hypothetical protein ACS0TY_021135 [Phlomoides rotata]